MYDKPIMGGTTEYLRAVRRLVVNVLAFAFVVYVILGLVSAALPTTIGHWEIERRTVCCEHRINLRKLYYSKTPHLCPYCGKTFGGTVPTTQHPYQLTKDSKHWFIYYRNYRE